VLVEWTRGEPVSWLTRSLPWQMARLTELIERCAYTADALSSARWSAAGAAAAFVAGYVETN
jgi:hypothetical protein